MISVVVPFCNERESIHELHERILRVLRAREERFEIIFVDDGSRDGTFEEMRKLSPIRAFRLPRNLGQTAAFGYGIAHAKGDVVVTMDGDLENFPEDVPKLLDTLIKGYDVVAGWRGDRWREQFFARRLPSLLANRLISKITGIRLHDHGCNLRAYRREVFRRVAFRGEIHRMLAAYLGMQGARIAEVPVSYAPRKFGKSKYGLSRTFKVLLDVLAFYFFREYGRRPMHFFGFSGFVSIGLGILTFLWALGLRVFEGTHLSRTPLPEIFAIFFVVGFQFILMGLLAEVVVRSRSSDGGREQWEGVEIVEKEWIKKGGRLPE
jgi:glycosyltransferase involved in cell wall biosynthesis